MIFEEHHLRLNNTSRPVEQMPQSSVWDAVGTIFEVLRRQNNNSRPAKQTSPPLGAEV
jgi:hypothetical protein